MYEEDVKVVNGIFLLIFNQIVLLIVDLIENGFLYKENFIFIKILEVYLKKIKISINYFCYDLTVENIGDVFENQINN